MSKNEELLNEIIDLHRREESVLEKLITDRKKKRQKRQKRKIVNKHGISGYRVNKIVEMQQVTKSHKIRELWKLGVKDVNEISMLLKEPYPFVYNVIRKHTGRKSLATRKLLVS